MAHQFFFNSYILDNLPAPAKGFDVVQDLSEPRLRMYITSRGVKTFFVRKRVHGRDRRIIIGNYPDVDIEQARLSVSGILEEAAKKIPVRRKKIPFKDFIQIYIKNRVRRCEDSEVKLLRAINTHLQDLFDINIDAISGQNVSDVISKIHGRAIAGRMQELLQSVFKYALEMGYVKKNPIANMPRIIQCRRYRPLTANGLRSLVQAINQEESQMLRGAFLMLIYSFLPKSKIFAMQWQDLDFNRYVWRDWPLSDMASVLLQNMPQDNCDWVFVGRAKNHLADPRVAWARVAENAKIPDLTMDDVHKFMMRHLEWASDREDVRRNMNILLEQLLTY
ncbi:MAG: integrase family protein [Proteobacteria bacterium]|nr:integrase family protein [Candidatus Enterousia scatequi]